MKYKEAISRFEELGYKAVVNGNLIEVATKDEFLEALYFDTNTDETVLPSSFWTMKYGYSLLDIVNKLQNTPENERVSKPLYYVLFMNDTFDFDEDSYLFLNLDTSDNSLVKYARTKNECMQAQFTMDEIETHISRLHLIMPLATGYSDNERGYKIISTSEMERIKGSIR